MTSPLARLDAEVAACRACPRLVAWREQVAVTRRRAYAEETYWGRPVPGFGDPHARVMIVGLAPAAHGANRTGRMFTGDRSADVLIAANCTLAATNHEFRDPARLIRDQGFMESRGGIVIEDDVWIGAGCVLLDGAIVRQGSVIAAGAVVRDERPAYSISAGVPAKTVGWRR